MGRRTVIRSLLLLALFPLIATGCSLPFTPSSNGFHINMTSVPAKIALASGAAAIQVAAAEYGGITIDANDLIKQLVVDNNALVGTPPSDGATLMVINKSTNDILYWRLTDNVKEITLTDVNPGSITLKVRNESPLRVELWITGDIKDVNVTLTLKN